MAEKLYCKNCGEEIHIPEGRSEAFCPYCGFRNSMKADGEACVVESLSSDGEQSMPMPPMPNGGEFEAMKKAKQPGAKVIAVIGSVAGVALVVVLVVAVLVHSVTASIGTRPCARL